LQKLKLRPLGRALGLAEVKDRQPKTEGEGNGDEKEEHEQHRDEDQP
jgi:hypothetical protein